MRGQAGATSPHEAFFYYSTGGRLEAVRSGKWKLRLEGKQRGKKGTEVQLYDLTVDIGESKNVAADHPDVVARLSKLAAEHEAEINKNKRPVGRVAPAET